jgi:hypothetical protein
VKPIRNMRALRILNTLFDLQAKDRVKPFIRFASLDASPYPRSTLRALRILNTLFDLHAKKLMKPLLVLRARAYLNPPSKCLPLIHETQTWVACPSCRETHNLIASLSSIETLHLNACLSAVR